ncbi:hypothetical protein [Reyranella sp. CPCC 100927]|uniref:hypothetical protein n=1 Tax=Reyranella sp. CPCC 100927 TaxID=2599616 RepID=UPI0011B49CE4|nr:hypothetical protein [Reyranella sp. CPCC 100927]TWT13550.1 hypothetical protein FQU96_06380 [Reyranella sp. CPCC 100927]
MLKLLKAIATTGSASGLTLLLGLLTNKIVAVTLGPTGSGLLASYRSIHEMAAYLGTMAGPTAQVQALSSVEGEARRRRLVACVWLTLTGMIIFSLVLLIGAPLIADHFFRDSSADTVVAIRSLVITLCVALAAVMAAGLINVSGAIGWLAVVQICGSVAALILAWPLATAAAGGLQLAYVGMILVPITVQLVVAGVVCRKKGWFPSLGSAFRELPSRADLKHFTYFFIANIGTGLVDNASMLALRAAIIETEGQAGNGLFQAAWMLTQHNLTLLVGVFGVYLLPLLSMQHDEGERRRVLDETLPVIIVLTVMLAGGGLLFMPLVLRLLYSDAFLPAIEPLRWMLMANFFSALLSTFYTLIAARGRPLISAVFNLPWYVAFAGFGISVLTGRLDVSSMGLSDLEAIGAAFFVISILRLAVQMVLCWRLTSYVPALSVWRTGAVGFAVLIAAAWIGWSAREVDWLVSVPAAAVVCAMPLLLLNRKRLDLLRTSIRARLGR